MDKKFLVFLGTNGSVNVVPEDRPSPVGASVLLVFVFALALSLNVFLVTSLSTRVFSRVAFNVLLLHLALVCALDCVNVLGSLVVVIDTKPSVAFCRAAAMASQLTTALESWLVATLSAERAFTTSSATPDDGGSRGVALCQTLKKILPALWIYVVVVILPISFAVPAADMLVFADRYSCGFALPGGSFLYPSLLLLLGHVLPWGVAVTSWTSMAQHVTSTRSHQRKLALAAEHRRVLTLSGSTLPREGFGVKKLSSMEEDKFNTILIVIIIVYVLLLLPHILSVSVSQLSPSPLNHNEAADDRSASVEVAPTPTGTYDVFFIWSRYIVDVLVPLAVFMIHKEVRKKCEALFCCCCHVDNTVLHFEEERATPTDKADGRGGSKSRKAKVSVVANRRTPVLYATSEGLHLRLYDDVEGDDDDAGDAGAERTSRPSEGRRRTHAARGMKYRCEFCDLADLSTQTFASRKQQVVPSSNTYTVVDQQFPKHASAGHNEPTQRQVNHGDVTRRRSDGALADDAAQNNKKIVRFAQVQSINDTFTMKNPGTRATYAGRKEGDTSGR